MPIYAYRCASCGFEKDHLQKMSDPLLSVCPTCGQATYSKQVTAAGFQLKGNGWYATDFKNGGGKVDKQPADSTATEKSETPAPSPACPCAPEVAAACSAK
ncbi:MAG TPA: zinc ribbon domain-containing protein [Accumulibacter sp.]|nr:zinc ribbon domain-containing protein [Accumulibacter sp.]HPP45884.1 zinc ribbon domain-containing protein [Accumulibacter sp.]